MDRRRRTLVQMSAAGLCCLPWPAWSQSASVKTVGILAPSTRAREAVILEPFFEEMRALAWVEGQNVVYDWALGFDHEQMLDRLAAALAARRPDVIFAPPASAAIAAKRATSPYRSCLQAAPTRLAWG